MRQNVSRLKDHHDNKLKKFFRGNKWNENQNMANIINLSAVNFTT